MTGAPPWRRLDPRGAAARALAAALALLALSAAAAAALGPLALRHVEGAARIAAADAAALRIERAVAEAAARGAAVDPAATAAAAAWLDAVAPRLGAEAATLALLAEAQRLAAAAGVRVTDVAPLPEAAAELGAGLGAELGSPGALAAQGLGVAAVEARLVADHARLARLLAEPARGGARLVALDVSAAAADPFAEADRLAVRFVLAALRREPGP